MESLNEGVFTIYDDRTYLRQTKYIIIANLMSLIPKFGDIIDPYIWGGGTSDYTWGKVREFFIRHPEARRGQLPMHFYSELLSRDYVNFVGCPLTNKSWFLEKAVAAQVLPVQYLDSILIVLQENFGLETVEKRMFRMLANDVVSPLLRIHGITPDRVVFFENIASRKAIDSEGWRYMFREPTYLDPFQFALELGNYQKR